LFGTEVDVVSFGTPEGTGGSDAIFLATVKTSNGQSEQTRHVVLRICAGHRLIYDADFGLQFEVQQALAERKVPPVAAILAVEYSKEWFGRPFVVMEQVKGYVPPDRPPYTFESWLRDESPETQKAIWWNSVEAIAQLHQVDWKNSSFDCLTAGRTAVGLKPAMQWLRALLDEAPENRFRRTADGLWRLLSAEQPEILGDDVISWGDSRLANVLVNGTQVAALLDFEDVSLNQPEADLGSWLQQDIAFSKGLGLSRLAGFPSHTDTIERFTEMTGRKLGNMAWWMSFSRLRRYAMRAVTVGVAGRPGVVAVARNPSDMTT